MTCKVDCSLFHNKLVEYQMINQINGWNLKNTTIHYSGVKQTNQNRTIIQRNNEIFVSNINIFNSSSYNPLILIESNQFLLLNSSFTQITGNGTFGSVLYSSDALVEIRQCNFSYNQALEGGSLYFQNLNNGSIIEQSKFSHCSATARGGAIFLNKSFIKLKKSQFINCHSLMGGAIYYNLYRPKVSADSLLQSEASPNLFENNTADLFGNNMGSYPSKVLLLSGTTQDQQFVKQIDKDNIIVENLRSGEIITLSLQLLDEEDNPVQIFPNRIKKYPQFIQDFLFQFNIKAEVNQNFDQIEIRNQIFADLQNYNEAKHSWEFSNLKISSNSSLQNSQLNQGAIQLIAFSVKIKNSYGILQNTVYYLNLTVSFRKCKKGEVLSLRENVSECIPCPIGFYSMDEPIESNFSECSTCPQEAYKCEKDQIFLKEGYWKKNNESLQIYYCSNNPSNCKGSNEGNIKYCSEGFVGAMCESCDTYGSVWGEQYMKNGDFICIKCVEANSYKFIFPVIIILILILFYIIFSVNIALKLSKQLSSAYYFRKTGLFCIGRSSVRDMSPFYAKQLMHYLQVCGMINTYKFILPQLLYFIPNVISQPLTNFEHVLDCFLVKQQSQESIHEDHQNSNQSIPFVFMRAIWSLVLPMIILVLVSIIYAVLICLTKIQFKNFYVYNGLFFMIIFLQPNIASRLISIISCKIIDGVSYINSDSNYECYTSEHIKYCLIIVLPAIILWVLVIPCYILLKLTQQRNQLDNISTRMKFGFLYQEFRSKYFYWEFIKSYKKIILVIIFNFFQDYFFLKLCLISIALFLYLQLLEKVFPYQLKQFNILDKNITISLLFILVMNIILKDQSIKWILIGGQFITALFSVLICLILIILLLYEKINSFIPMKVYKISLFLKIKFPLIFFWMIPKKPLNAIRAFRNWNKVRSVLIFQGLLAKKRKNSNEKKESHNDLKQNQQMIKLQSIQEENNQIKQTKQQSVDKVQSKQGQFFTSDRQSKILNLIKVNDGSENKIIDTQNTQQKETTQQQKQSKNQLSLLSSSSSLSSSNSDDTQKTSEKKTQSQNIIISKNSSPNDEKNKIIDLNDFDIHQQNLPHSIVLSSNKQQIEMSQQRLSSSNLSIIFTPKRQNSPTHQNFKQLTKRVVKSEQNDLSQIDSSKTQFVEIHTEISRYNIGDYSKVSPLSRKDSGSVSPVCSNSQLSKKQKKGYFKNNLRQISREMSIETSPIKIEKTGSEIISAIKFSDGMKDLCQKSEVKNLTPSTMLLQFDDESLDGTQEASNNK